MKQIRRMVFVLFMLLLMAMGAYSASAETIIVKMPLKTNIWSKKIGAWTTDKKYNSLNNYLQITVPKNGYIKVSVDTGKKQSYTLFTSPGDYGTAKYCTAGQCVALNKGTYYIETSNSVRFKYIFREAVNNRNYSRDQAVPLGRNKKITVCQNESSSYNRWYRITLTSKQRITLLHENCEKSDVACTFSLYNSKGKQLTISRLGNKHMTADKLNKGTYYLCVGGDHSYRSVTVFTRK